MEKERDLLAARLEAGDHEAATELVDIYYKQIYLFMRRLGHDCQISEDLTQEIFLRAWQHIGQLKSGKAMKSWLYRIAINVSRLYRRRHKGKKLISLECIELADSVEADCDLEQLGRLKCAVGQLSVKLRQVVILHYLQQLSISEAAEAMGIREGTFKSRLNRALKALRKQII